MGEHEDRNIFFSDGDGNYVQFTGILEAQIEDCVKYRPEDFLPVFESGGELSFTVTGRTSRRFQKMIRAQLNHMKRVVRTIARRKEKARREKLKMMQ